MMAESALPLRGHDEVKALRLQVAALEATLIERSAEIARLRDSETRYRCLVEHSLGLICTHDATGRLLSINPAAARTLEYPPEEMIGRPISDFLSPRVRPAFAGYLTRVFTQGIDQGLMVVATRSGDELVWAYRNVRIDERGGPSYILGHAQDITAVERAREAIKRARAEMRERIAERTAELVAANRRLLSELGEHALIEESLRRSRTRLELLNEIAVGATATATRTGMIKRTVETMSRYFPDSCAFFARFGENGALTVLHQAVNAANVMRQPTPGVSWPDALVDLLRRGDAVLVQDALQDDRVHGSACQERSVIAVPIRRDEVVKGFIALTAAEPQHWADYDLETVREIAGYLSLALRDSVGE